MRDLITKLRTRRPAKPVARDWTNSWTARDWADLPVYHPRHNDAV